MARDVTKSPAPATARARSNGAPSHQDEILIREIDEAVRQDDAAQFMRRYGLAILGAIVVSLALLGGYMLWNNSRESRLEQQSETLISALDYARANDFKSAGEKVAPLLADGGPAARAAARFIQADAALEARDEGKAADILAAVAADPDAPQVLRDLALIREVSLRFDRMPPDDVIARLKGLAVPDHPFFGSAAELTAMAHLEARNRKEAGKLFAAIAMAEDQPETLRSRARQMAGLLGVDAIVDVTKLLKDEGVAESEGDGRSAASAR